MTTNGALTKTMRQAVAFARQHGGMLYRHPGGFWSGPEFSGYGESYGSSTVEALVARGVVEYAGWKEGRNGRFPIIAKVTKRKAGDTP